MMIILLLKLIPKEILPPSKELLLKCGFNIDRCFEFFHYDFRSYKNEQFKNADSKYSVPNGKKLKNNSCADILDNYSNILAYNNNTLDKMILAHAYQQRFGKVLKKN